MLTAHLASITTREKDLYHVLKSLVDQVDSVYVALNGYLKIPDWCNEFTNVVFKIFDNSLGDAAKFAFVNEVEGSVLICDDDLVWTPQGIEILKQKVAQYNCPCSFHGKKYTLPFRGFKYFSGNYRCLNTVDGDHPVDVIGTGTLMFVKSMVKLTLEDFPVKNMADVFFSRLCKMQGVSMMAVEHKNNVVKYTYPASTIWQSTKDYTTHNRIIKDFLK